MASQPSDGSASRPILRVMKSLLFGRGTSLREAIEGALEEHEDDEETGLVSGDLSAPERLMLRNLLDFGERKAGDIMVPRGDIMAFEASGEVNELVAAFADAGHSRLPIYAGELDKVLGMIHVKDLFNELAMDRGESAKIADLVRPVLFVPSAMRVLDLLARMRTNRTHMAIVVDEYGGTDGLVTVEDIVEEIVGEIEDEHDEPEDEPIRPLPTGGYEVEARVDIDDFEERLETDFTSAVDGEIDTVGGLLFMIEGRVPAQGETVEHPAGWRFEILAGDERRVERVRVQRSAD
ncbi:magnesium/cobalt efflux protein [Pacificimonas flava]|uniref:Magnesium/cobalt efflux protein n=3 Tax=Pacificimonas TaxID=1960290 RepID=A0A219B1Y5_9SPHN|nr:hemolysin family protein [Pacificimonas flava]MBZ6378244.1 HlyC/CorC family transporter [Pacificimonas aurantium]OWV32133.1 magnesium/cobalt efflux protein [Pacificimonas flava]